MMRARVEKDDTVRTIRIEVSGVDDLDVTRRWHNAPRVIRPDQVVIKVVGHQPTSITASGPRMLKSGNLSDKVRDDAEWRADGYFAGEALDDAPEWVRVLFREAPQGVTEWTES